MRAPASPLWATVTRMRSPSSVAATSATPPLLLFLALRRLCQSVLDGFIQPTADLSRTSTTKVLLNARHLVLAFSVTLPNKPHLNHVFSRLQLTSFHNGVCSQEVSGWWQCQKVGNSGRRRTVGLQTPVLICSLSLSWTSEVERLKPSLRPAPARCPHRPGVPTAQCPHSLSVHTAWCPHSPLSTQPGACTTS